MLSGVGYVVCGALSCVRPDAAAEILADGETGHLVLFSEHDFTIKHPLIERLDGALFSCGVSAALADLDGPAAAPGSVWRVSVSPGGRETWEQVSGRGRG